MNNKRINKQFLLAVVEISEGRHVVYARQSTANLWPMMR